MFQKGANLAAMLVVSRYNYPVLAVGTNYQRTYGNSAIEEQLRSMHYALQLASKSNTCIG